MSENGESNDDRGRLLSAFEFYGEMILAAAILGIPLLLDLLVDSAGILLNSNINYPITAAIFTVIISATVVLLVEASNRTKLVASAKRENQYAFYKATFRRPVMLATFGLIISTIASVFNLGPNSVLRSLPIDYIVVLIIYFFLLSSVISFLALVRFAVTTLFGETEKEVEKLLDEIEEE